MSRAQKEFKRLVKEYNEAHYGIGAPTLIQRLAYESAMRRLADFVAANADLIRVETVKKVKHELQD